MSLLTTAVSADDGRDTGLEGIGCVGGADFLVLAISKVERPYKISWRSKISSWGITSWESTTWDAGTVEINSTNTLTMVFVCTGSRIYRAMQDSCSLPWRQEGKDNKQTNKRKKTKKINEGILKAIQKNDRADDKKKSKPLSGRGERLDELEDRAELVAKRRCSPDDDNMCEGVHEGWTQGDLTIDQASGLVHDPKVEVRLLHCGGLEWSSSQWSWGDCDKTKHHDGSQILARDEYSPSSSTTITAAWDVAG